MGGPHVNERFYGFPTSRVLALVEEKDQVQRILEELAADGLDLDTVDVLTGEKGVELLDVSGAAHGLRGRLVRLLEDLAYERDRLAGYEAALRAGHDLVIVPASTTAERNRIRDSLLAHGAHYLLWFGDTTVIDLSARTVAADAAEGTPARDHGGHPLHWISKQDAERFVPLSAGAAQEPPDPLSTRPSVLTVSRAVAAAHLPST